MLKLDLQKTLPGGVRLPHRFLSPKVYSATGVCPQHLFSVRGDSWAVQDIPAFRTVPMKPKIRVVLVGPSIRFLSGISFRIDRGNGSPLSEYAAQKIFSRVEAGRGSSLYRILHG